EAIIAGRGSGSAQFSEDNNSTVLNIDIGGGTSNYVVFRTGKVIDTCCLNVGGRLVQTDVSGNVTKLSKPAIKILKHIVPNFNQDYSGLSLREIELICDVMAELIIECMENTNLSLLAKELLLTNPFRQYYTYSAVFLSGGVGECFYTIDELVQNKF